jgi:hypothetical protein
MMMTINQKPRVNSGAPECKQFRTAWFVWNRQAGDWTYQVCANIFIQGSVLTGFITRALSLKLFSSSIQDTTCTILYIQHVQYNRYNMYNTIYTTCTIQ